MQRKTPKYLDDIRDATQFILDLARGRTLEDYSRDRVFRQTIERNFEIIGEAMNRIAKSDPAVAARIGHYSQIIAFRNVLAHGYDLIENDRVWDVVQNESSGLLHVVEELLREANGGF
jgi:uncharacterized protein with HEPN domain